MNFLSIFSFSLIGIAIKTSDEQYDLIIIGGGLAGLTAAYESNMKSNISLNIALIEGLSDIGGNSNRATSGINLLETEPQRRKNIIDNYTIFYQDTMKSGKNINDPLLVSTFINGTKTLYDYYTNNFDIDITLLGQLGGHSVARTHRPTDSNFVIGSYLISKVSQVVKNSNKITIYYNSTLTELLKNENNNEVYGLKYKRNNESTDNKIYCDAIILTSGGYGHDFGDDGLLKEFVPEYMNFPTTNGEQTIGSGVKLGRKIGAQLIDMKQVQIHPTGFVDPKNRYNKKKFLAPELLRGVGGILINENGQRFCNELGTRDYVTEKVLQNCKKQDTDEIDQYESYLLMNQEMANEFGNNFYFYKDVQGFIEQHSNFSELSKSVGIDYNNLEKTINSYNEAFEKKLDEFNKTTFPYKFNLNDTIYSMIITPSIHYTMGGLKINNKAEVLDVNNKTIKGLFGAGEVTGGVHGGNRLGGNSLAECGVYGRISADSAVDYIINKKNNSDIIQIIPKNKSSGRIGTGAIIGIIIAGVVLLLAAILISIFGCKRKSNDIEGHNKNQNEQSTNKISLSRESNKKKK